MSSVWDIVDAIHASSELDITFPKTHAALFTYCTRCRMCKCCRIVCGWRLNTQRTTQNCTTHITLGELMTFAAPSVLLCCHLITNNLYFLHQYHPYVMFISIFFSFHSPKLLHLYSLLVAAAGEVPQPSPHQVVAINPSLCSYSRLFCLYQVFIVAPTLEPIVLSTSPT